LAPTPSSAGERPTPPFEHRPSLDGIRAVAVLLVIAFHAGMTALGHGYVGVDVFFVLSGFLITSLLARELLGSGRLRFVAFYARRVRRLLPAALLVLLVTAVAYELVASPAAVSETRGGFVASALYFANWFFLRQANDYFAQGAHPSPVEHYWSLSVEEQFYLVWPALMVGLVFLARCGLRLEVVAATLALAVRSTQESLPAPIRWLRTSARPPAPTSSCWAQRSRFSASAAGDRAECAGGPGLRHRGRRRSPRSASRSFSSPGLLCFGRARRTGTGSPRPAEALSSSSAWSSPHARDRAESWPGRPHNSSAAGPTPPICGTGL
jgi:hypothetical protein